MSTSFTTFLTDLRDYNLDKTDTKAQRVVMRACNDGLRFLADFGDWEHFNARGRINTHAWITSGTCAIAAGGAEVTFTGASNTPSDAVGMKIRIAGAEADHEIGTRTGNATLTFVTSDIWNGTVQTVATYALYHDRYSLPTDCARFGTLLPENDSWGNVEWSESFQDWIEYKVNHPEDTGDPALLAVDSTYIYFWPPPNEKVAIDFTYQRVPTEVTALGSVIDFPDNYLHLLRAITRIFLMGAEGKIAPDEIEARAGVIANGYRSKIPKYRGPTCMRPMPIEIPAQTRFNTHV